MSIKYSHFWGGYIQIIITKGPHRVFKMLNWRSSCSNSLSRIIGESHHVIEIRLVFYLSWVVSDPSILFYLKLSPSSWFWLGCPAWGFFLWFWEIQGEDMVLLNINWGLELFDKESYSQSIFWIRLAYSPLELRSHGIWKPTIFPSTAVDFCLGQEIPSIARNVYV